MCNNENGLLKSSVANGWLSGSIRSEALFNRALSKKVTKKHPRVRISNYRGRTKIKAQEAGKETSLAWRPNRSKTVINEFLFSVSLLHLCVRVFVLRGQKSARDLPTNHHRCCVSSSSSSAASRRRGRKRQAGQDCAGLHSEVNLAQSASEAKRSEKTTRGERKEKKP